MSLACFAFRISFLSVQITQLFLSLLFSKFFLPCKAYVEKRTTNHQDLQSTVILISCTHAPLQGGYEQLLQTMEKRMMDVEQQLRLVKQLLQDKVNQLKEQVRILSSF